MPRVSQLVLRSLDGLSLNLVGPASVVLDGLNAQREVCVHSPVERLAYKSCIRRQGPFGETAKFQPYQRQEPRLQRALLCELP